jgi:peptidoglycan/xylan/chitin deacetylase (PgdA/CDA1 family)
MITRRAILGAAAAYAGSAWGAEQKAQVISGGNVVFVTSDDGPGAGTATIIDIAERHQVPIALFMIGMNATANPEHRSLLARARKSRWITVGNHSHSHCLSHYVRCYRDSKSMVADFRKASTDLGLISRPLFARGPGRNVWRLPGMRIDDPAISAAEMGIEDSADDLLYANGFYLYGWDVEWTHDARGIPLQDSNSIVNQLADRVPHSRRPGKVVLLMHDIMLRTASAASELAAIIEGIRSRGLRFGRLNEY